MATSLQEVGTPRENFGSLPCKATAYQILMLSQILFFLHPIPLSLVLGGNFLYWVSVAVGNRYLKVLGKYTYLIGLAIETRTFFIPTFYTTSFLVGFLSLGIVILKHLEREQPEDSVILPWYTLGLTFFVAGCAKLLFGRLQAFWPEYFSKVTECACLKLIVPLSLLLLLLDYII